MNRTNISMLSFAAWIAIVIGAAPLPALAGSTGNGTAGFGLPQFKDLPMYRFEADAQRLCKGDTVVWGSSQNIGIYFVKGHGPYSPTGARIGGYYACMGQAKAAGYKIE